MTASMQETKLPSSSSKLSGLIGGAKYIGILLGLLAFGYAGHQTHWTFNFANHHDEKVPHEPPVARPAEHEAEPTNPKPSEEWSVEFPSEKSLKRSGIKTVPLEQRAMREQIKTTGVITYDERMFASLSARVSGTVWRVLKQPGDSIRRGDVLVIIDAADVGSAKAEFFSDLVEVESKAEVLSMLEKVTGAVPERQVREARVSLRESKIRLQNSEQTLINMGFKLRKEDFEGLSDADRSAKLHFLGLPESIASGLNAVQTTSNLMPLTASFDGVLLHHDAAMGEMVEAGKPLVEIADMRRMWLKLDVPKEDAARLALGQSVRFLPDGLDEELESTITWISTEMDAQTRTLRIRAEVENPVVSSDPKTGQEVRILRANTFGTGIITLRETPEAFVVPASSVLHDDSQPMIFTRSDNLKFVRINVQVGVREQGFIQVESDLLKPGMQIVSQGSHVLKSEWILNHMASAAP